MFYFTCNHGLIVIFLLFYAFKQLHTTKQGQQQYYSEVQWVAKGWYLATIYTAPENKKKQ